MMTRNKQITILSDSEWAALYERPDFDNEQRFKYLTLTANELNIALSRKSLTAKVHCILQLGYFKAVKLFFRITWEQINCEDINFILQQYFSGNKLEARFKIKSQHLSTGMINSWNFHFSGLYNN